MFVFIWLSGLYRNFETKYTSTQPTHEWSFDCHILSLWFFCSEIHEVCSEWTSNCYWMSSEQITVIIWPDQVSFWWMDFIVFTHWKNSQSIDRHVALIGNLIPSLSQSVFLSYSFILSSNKSQFYRFDTSGDLTYDLLVYATGGEQANHYTTEAVKEKF